MAAIEEIGDNVKKIRPSKASSFMIDDILSNQAKLSAGKSVLFVTVRPPLMYVFDHGFIIFLAVFEISKNGVHTMFLRQFVITNIATFDNIGVAHKVTNVSRCLALTEQTSFQSAAQIHNNLATINAAMLSRVQPRVPLLPPLQQAMNPGGEFFESVFTFPMGKGFNPAWDGFAVGS